MISTLFIDFIEMIKVSKFSKQLVQHARYNEGELQQQPHLQSIDIIT